MIFHKLLKLNEQQSLIVMEKQFFHTTGNYQIKIYVMFAHAFLPVLSKVLNDFEKMQYISEQK